MKNSKTFIWSLVGLVATSICMTSCKKDEYNFNAAFDKTIQLGGNISLPVGYSEKIALSKIIKLSESVDTVKFVGDEDLKVYNLEAGDYYFISKSSPNDNKNKFSTTKSSLNLKNNFAAPITEVFTSKGGTINYQIKLTAEIPNTEILNLNWIETDKPIAININLSCKNAINLRNVAIKVPSEFCLANDDNKAYTIDSKNTAIFKSVSLAAGMTKKLTLYIEKIFCNYDRNKMGSTMILGDDTKNNFLTVTAESTNIKSGYENITMSCEITGDTGSGIDYNITLANGIFAPTTKEAQEFEITGLPDVLTDKNTKLHVNRPIIEFKVEDKEIEVLKFKHIVFESVYDNNENVSVSMENMSVHKEGSVFTAVITNQNYSVPELTICPELSNLINEKEKIPGKVKLSIQNNHIEGTVKFGKEYKIDYRFILPFDFKYNTEIFYSDMMNNWNKKIKDVKISDLNNSPITLTATINNTTPYDVIIKKMNPLKKINNSSMEFDTSEFDIDFQKIRIEANSSNSLTAILYPKKEGVLNILDGINFEMVMKVDKSDKVLNNAKHSLQFKNIIMKSEKGLIFDFN